MNRNYVENCPLKAPGLAIGSGGKTTFSFANAFIAKAEGIVSVAATPADAPALTTALNKAGAVPGVLAVDHKRVYTLLATVSAAGVLAYTLVAGEDFAESRAMKMSDINFGNPGDENKAVIGFVMIHTTTNAFTPGTTALDATGVTATYFDNYGFVGM